MKFIEGWYLPDGEKHFSNYLMEVKNSKFPREYQKQQRDNSIKFVDSFNTAIDIGACVGFWTRDLCKVFKRIICFEPYKNSSDCLIENLKEFDNYELYNVALSNQSGKGDLLISKPFTFNNLMAPELKTLNTLPEIVNSNVGYYSICMLVISLLNIEGNLDRLKPTKLYFLMERILKETPSKRRFIYI